MFCLWNMEESIKTELKQFIDEHIFDEDQLIKNKVFATDKINENIFGFGTHIPKFEDVKDKKGNILRKRQILNPIFIHSGKNFIEANDFGIEKTYKIKFSAIPSNPEYRWRLDSIKNFLENKSPKVNGKEIFENIKKEGYEKFCFFRSKEWYSFHTLWDMGTYLHQIFHNYPIAELRGLMGTAKTKVMKISRLFSLNPTKIMVNPSEATLFRETHEKRPTKYIDEAERLFKWNKGQLESDNRVELINASYSKGSSVPRVEKIGNKFVIIYYECYSPTMIGSIRGLYGATESRAITHIMTKNPDKDDRGNLEVEDFEQKELYQETRDQLYLFALQNWKEIENIYRSIKIKADIKKRDLQIWKPLLSIAKFIDEELFNEMVRFAEKLSRQRKQDFISEESFDFKILSIVKNLCEENTVVRTKEIKKQYMNIYKKDDEKVKQERSFSSRLDNLGFKELREKDREGSYFNITKEDFDIIVSPICPDLSSQSSQSSQSLIKEEKDVMNKDNFVTVDDENEQKDVTVVTVGDENDDYKKVTNKISDQEAEKILEDFE